MTLLLIISALMIAFILLLRYDIHKHKYVDPEKLKHSASQAVPEKTSEADSKNPTHNHNSDGSD